MGVRGGQCKAASDKTKQLGILPNPTPCTAVHLELLRNYPYGPLALAFVVNSIESMYFLHRFWLTQTPGLELRYVGNAIVLNDINHLPPMKGH